MLIVARSGSPSGQSVGGVPLGLYGRYVLPRLVNHVCAQPIASRQRQRVCSGLAGRVVEIGFGSGLNVPFYPAQVQEVVAVEPADVAWQLAAERVAAAAVPVVRVGLDAQGLPLEDDSVDAALSTWTLCTVPDPARALAELRRVLRPGGVLHFLEHGLSPDDEDVRRWQRRLEPMQKRLAGGCHLTREILPLLARAGFEVTEAETYYQEGTPRAWGANTLGRARTPVRDTPDGAAGEFAT